jgi:hypothetical protein
MKNPLTNDFGIPISRDQARCVLEASGWIFHKSMWYRPAKKHKWEPQGFSLRDAWEKHKGVMVQ